MVDYCFNLTTSLKALFLNIGTFSHVGLQHMNWGGGTTIQPRIQRNLFGGMEREVSGPCR